MKTCQELFEAYISPRMFRKEQDLGFPKYQWVAQKKDVGGKNKCRVIETEQSGEIRTFDAIWIKNEDLALQKILRENNRLSKRER